MSRKRANGESIDAMRMRTDDMMMCVDDVDSIIAQENDSGPKRAIVSCNFVNYLSLKL